MNFMKTVTLAALLSLGALLAPPARAQVVLSQTTLAGALSATTSTLALTSGTGVSLPGPNQTNLTVLVVEREVMLVQTNLAGTVYGVARAQYGTLRVAHANGAVVWIAPDKAIARGAIPSGSCTRTNMPYVPIVYVAPSVINGGVTGATFDCLGGQLVRTNAPSTAAGGTVSSATSITPTGTYFPVSGTTAIATIVVPAGWSAGNCLAIEPTGIFATTTAANIGLITSSTVVGRILFMCWDGTKWWPSYVS
jgi:hypothetical protein